MVLGLFDYIDDLSGYKSLYAEGLFDALNQFYQDRTPDKRWILSAAKNQGSEMLLLDEDLFPEKTKRLFAAFVFYVCLIPQVIARVAGKDAKQCFHDASGWPVMSAGLGGFVSPGQWLKESGLAPDSSEVSGFNNLLFEAMPFHLDEFTAFINGKREKRNARALETLRKSLEGKQEAFKAEMQSAVGRAMWEFSSGTISVYYLAEEECY